MPQNDNRIFIYFNNDELRELVAKFGTDLKSDLTKQMKEYLLAAPTENQVTDIDSETKQWKLRKLKAETQIKEHELLHIDTFGTKPSPEAQNAINQRFDSAKPQTAKQISINSVLRFMESCRQNELNQWVVICEKCRADFIDTNREKALSEFRDHMTKQHAKELLT